MSHTSCHSRLIQSGKMYIVPAQCFDDYYWMLASVSNQNTTDDSFIVSANDSSDRFPGLRPMLISNDQMRDHRLELLEPRLFRRWYSCHIVRYSLTNFEQNEWEPREITFFPAEFFSREVQGNKMNHEEVVGTAWHFPVREWESKTDRLCIAIPR